MSKRSLLIFVAFYIAAKVNEHDKKIPFTEDILEKLGMNCSKEEFYHFEKMIFWKVLKGNALLTTPYEKMNEILMYL